MTLSEEPGMRPELALTHLTLGRILRGRGDHREAERHLVAAAEMPGAMGTGWAGEVGDELHAVKGAARRDGTTRGE
jgi:uncharacterized protein HemY